MKKINLNTYDTLLMTKNLALPDKSKIGKRVRQRYNHSIFEKTINNEAFIEITKKSDNSYDVTTTQ